VVTPNEEILAYLTEAPTSTFAGQAVEIVDHWQGSANLLWRVHARGQDAVLKFYLDAGQVRSRRQYDGQALFAPYGLAPQPLWLDRIPETLPRSVLVYRWVDGAPFDAGDNYQWQRLAQLLAQVHTAAADDMQRFSPHPVNLAYFWSVLGPSLPPLQNWLAAQRLVRLSDLVGQLHGCGQRAVDAALPLWSQAPVAVHGDLQPENFLNSFGAVVLLDWEMFGLGDAALEIARFLHEQRTAISSEVLENWLDSYLEHLGDPAAQVRIEVYRQRLLPLQDAAYLLGGGMKLTDGERQSQELRDNREFLSTTLQQALAQAALALGGGDIQGDEGVANECAALFSGEIST
jgi:aminoglycoside phosphotransferase (APT) family kinase protein